MARDHQKQRSELVKQEILSTALKIALEEGFDSLSVRKISSRMNYTTGVIYHHYKDKQEIIDAIQDKESAKMRRLIQSALLPEENLAANLRSVFHAVTLLAYSQPEEYNLVVLQRHKRGERDRPELLNLLVSLLEKEDSWNVKSDSEKQAAAFAVWSSFLGFNLNISKMSRHLSESDLERLFTAQIDLIVRGVLAI